MRSGGGRLSVSAAGSYARSTASGVNPVADVDMTTSYQWNQATASAYLTVVLRGTGTWQNAYRPTNGYALELTPNGTAVAVYKNVNGTRTSLASVANGSRATTAKQWLRYRITGQQLMFRTWLDGQPEPATWAWTGTDPSLGAPPGVRLLPGVSTSVVSHTRID